MNPTEDPNINPDEVLRAFATNLNPMLKQKNIRIPQQGDEGGTGTTELQVKSFNERGWFECEAIGGDGSVLKVPANETYVPLVFQKLGIFATHGAGAETARY